MGLLLHFYDDVCVIGAYDCFRSSLEYIFSSLLLDFLAANFGLYLPSNIEFPTTVTELIAIAKPASIGSHPNIPTPIKGTSMPPAIGINPALYAKAQKRFCLIFETVFLPRSSAVTTSLISSFIS